VTHKGTYPKPFRADGLDLNELKDGLKGRIGGLSFRSHHGRNGSMSQRHDSERGRDHVSEQAMRVQYGTTGMS
jgi:hypothetical protein